LLAFLANDGCDSSDDAIIAIDSQGLADILQSADNKHGEAFCKRKSIIDIGGWEVILARQWSGDLEVLQDVDGIDGM
jgi:hypothetical protein